MSPLVTVVVPAYNEGAELGRNLETLLSYLRGPGMPYDCEVLVVDDGSTDETYLAAQNAACAELRIVRHSRNRGLGCAIRTGFAYADGAIMVVYDSDLSYSPDIIPKMVEQMQAQEDDLVLASPYMRGGRVSNVPFLRRCLSREANRFLSFATNGRYATLTCMVRAYRIAFFQRVESREERMEVNPELVFAALKGGGRVSEIPAILAWSDRRVKSRSRLGAARALRQIVRTMRCGVKHRPAILLALPGIVPGVLPLIVATMVFMHASLTTMAIVTLITMIVQNASLALFAGQLALFGRNVLRTPRLESTRNDH